MVDIPTSTRLGGRRPKDDGFGLQLMGLEDKRQPGPAPKYGAEAGRRILALLDGPPSKGFARWTGPLIAEALGDVHKQRVWRFLRDQKIDFAGRKSWCESDDREFVAKAAEGVGLYMAPPHNAIVICVDEKPSIQAAGPGISEAAQRPGTEWPRPRRQAQQHLDAVCRLRGGHRPGDRGSQETAAAHRVLDFMNGIVATYPGKDLHVVLDNLSTHKPKCDRWLKRHPQVHFHFTPTRASWLNRVEIWLSILEGKSLSGASFTSVKQLKEHIDTFIEAYNRNPTPFAWTKAVVHQRRFKDRRISQL
jgi:transposase